MTDLFLDQSADIVKTIPAWMNDFKAVRFSKVAAFGKR